MATRPHGVTLRSFVSPDDHSVRVVFVHTDTGVIAVEKSIDDQDTTAREAAFEQAFAGMLANMNREVRREQQAADAEALEARFAERRRALLAQQADEPQSRRERPHQPERRARERARLALLGGA